MNSPAPGVRHIRTEAEDRIERQLLSGREQEAPTSSTADGAKQVPQPRGDEGNRSCAEVASSRNHGDRQREGDPSAWREELAGRLDRYRERRKPRAPRYPSLQLRFEEPSSRAASPGPFDYEAHHDSVLPPVSCQAVALEEDLASLPDLGRILRQQGEAAASSPASPRVPGPSSGHSASGKIIEFPRSCAVPPVPLDELAEPVTDRPRILEAPAVAPPPPALGGITIEAPERQEAEKRPGIDIPLQSAPLGRRIFAAMVDGIVIAAASALCGSPISTARPPPDASGAGAYWPLFSPPQLSAWATPGFFSTKTPSAGTIASPTPTWLRGFGVRGLAAQLLEHYQSQPFMSARLALCYLQCLSY